MTKSNFASYKKELDKEIARQIEEQKKTFREIVFTTFSSVMDLAPVDRGYLRTNNMIKANNPDNSYDLEKIESVSSKNNEAKGVIDSTIVKDGTKIFITNNMPYADRIEYQGWSQKAPNGFFRISEEKSRQLILRKQREIIKGRKI